MSEAMSTTAGQGAWLAFALLVGLVLGAFFFYGLWWTVQRALGSRAPAAWFLGSLVLRTGVTLVGFYLVSAGHWQRLVACLVGFVVARRLVMRATDTKASASEVDHAP